jgi:hypothetical protein
MAFLFVAVVLVLLAWLNRATVQAMRRTRASRHWWLALAALWLFGAAAGGWCMEQEQVVSPTARSYGFPVVVGEQRWEGEPGAERWVTYLPPAPQLWAGANLLFFILLAGGLVGVAFLIARRRAAARGKLP